MNLIIKNRLLKQDYFNFISCEESVFFIKTLSFPIGKVIVPIDMWFFFKNKILSNKYVIYNIGVWFSTKQIISSDMFFLENICLIAIYFSSYNDGRGYSIAYLLRIHYNYKKEIRAIGYFLIDQLYLLEYSGFNSYFIHDYRFIKKVLKNFNSFIYNSNIYMDLKK